MPTGTIQTARQAWVNDFGTFVPEEWHQRAIYAQFQSVIIVMRSKSAAAQIDLQNFESGPNRNPERKEAQLSVAEYEGNQMGGDYSTNGKLEFARLKPRRRVGLWLILAGLLLVLGYFSIQPVMRLAPNPPPEFFEVRSNWDQQQREAEEQLARAYWERAVTVVQREHAYGLELPEQPPPEFQVETRHLIGSVNVEPSSEERYWQKLRKAWYLPHAWRRSYKWNRDWADRFVRFYFT